MTVKSARDRKTVAGITVPQRLHLDKRIPVILTIDANKSDEDLLTTKATAAWLQVSVEWLENGRIAEYGPPYVTLGPRLVRYRRGDVRKFLRERTASSTAEARQKLALIDA